jgi:hypothetical protein
MPRRTSIPPIKQSFSFFNILDETFGTKSHFIRALFVLWVTTSISLIVMNVLGLKKSSLLQVATYILSTALVVIISSFSATCFKFGDCPRAAYAVASMGILFISASALNFN